MSTTTATYVPPPGWVTNRQAAEMMGVSTETMTQACWKYRSMLAGTRKCINVYNQGTISLYPLEVIDKIRAAQAVDALPPPLPEGFVDKDGACAFFGIERGTWRKWIQEGKVRCGQINPLHYGGRKTLYAIEDLQRLKATLFDESRLYMRSDCTWHIPAGYLTKDQACETFGVSLSIWERWEREGTITCGLANATRPKLYKLEDIHRLLDEYGKYCPPYPDPELSNTYRVPLGGRDIKRREALIDPDTLRLIEGAHLCWSPDSYGSGFVGLTSEKYHSVPLRRLILGINDSNENVRHANGDALDCRRENLLVRTARQRVRNKRKTMALNGVPTSSRFKGVHWDKQTKKWRAVIRPDGKNRSLGRHTDEIAAAQAYDEAAIKWFGQDAWLNFPNGLDAWLESEGFTSPSKLLPRAA